MLIPVESGGGLRHDQKQLKEIVLTNDSIRKKLWPQLDKEMEARDERLLDDLILRTPDEKYLYELEVQLGTYNVVSNRDIKGLWWFVDMYGGFFCRGHRWHNPHY